jgi:dienelactone hydrolase
MEKIITIGKENEALRGVLHEPECPNGVGVVFLHGWPGNRIGPHRMFVTMARRLEALGFYGLRIDFHGRGDSDGRAEDASIRSMIDDTARAVDFLAARPQVKRLYLLGICSGGKVAIGAASADPRLRGLVLWSAEAMGQLRTRAARTHKSMSALRLYLKKLTAVETWKKILTFRVNTRMVRKAIVTDETPRDAEIAHESAMLDRFKAFRGDILFIYGGNDPNTKYAAEAYTQFCNRHGIRSEFHEIPDANHSFYSLEWERDVLEWSERWFVKQAENDRL